MLKDRIANDITNEFMNPEHFAEYHTWNGVPFLCVLDEEAFIKRKKNRIGAAENPWMASNHTAVIYTPKETFPGRAVADEQAFFDGRNVRILEVTEDMGVLSLSISTISPRSL